VKAGTNVLAKVSAVDVNGKAVPFDADASGITSKYAAASKTATWTSATTTQNYRVVLGTPVSLGSAQGVFSIYFTQPVVVTTKATAADYDNEWNAIVNKTKKSPKKSTKKAAPAAKKATALKAGVPAAKKNAAVTKAATKPTTAAQRLAKTGSDVAVVSAAVVFLTIVGLGTVMIRRRA
jgi:hypothetical protein